MKEILFVVISLVGVLGLFFMFAVGMRKLTKRVSFTAGGKLRVLDRVSIGRDSMILVVSVCGKLMLIGVSGQSVVKLAELDMSEEEYTAAAAVPGNAGFFDIFSGILKKKEKKENKPEEDEYRDEDEGNS